jgi:hypothetical protein
MSSVKTGAQSHVSRQLQPRYVSINDTGRMMCVNRHTCAVSPRALNSLAPMDSSVARLGIKPQRIMTGWHVPAAGSRMVVNSCCVGAMFHDRRKFGAGGPRNEAES